MTRIASYLLFIPWLSFGQSDTTFCTEPDLMPEPLNGSKDFFWFNEHCIRNLELSCNEDPILARFYMEIIVEPSGELSSVTMIQKNDDLECYLAPCPTEGATSYTPAMLNGKTCRFKGRVPVIIHFD